MQNLALQNSAQLDQIRIDQLEMLQAVDEAIGGNPAFGIVGIMIEVPRGAMKTVTVKAGAVSTVDFSYTGNEKPAMSAMKELVVPAHAN